LTPVWGAGPELLATRLVEMMVVDRSLKPHYILESAACLHRLTIDWQVPTSCAFFTSIIKQK
jgi:hypothetical protein